MHNKSVERLDELERLAALSDDARMREVMEGERRLAKVQAENASLKRRLAVMQAELREAQESSEFFAELQAGRLSEIDFGELSGKNKGKSTAVLTLSDWHCEERVDPATVNQRNAYDLTICERRIKTTFEKACYWLEILKSGSSFDTLVVAALGDFITGYIHPELVEVAQLSPTEACFFSADLLHSGIQKILKRKLVKRIIVATALGNHARTTEKSRIATSYKNNFEWAMYEWMARGYRGESRVKWKIEKSYHNWLELHGRQIRLHHGDYINYQGGVGGITIPANKAVGEWNKSKRADFDIFGHWHQWIWNPYWMLNGSAIGWNPYAIRIKAPFQEPAQMLAMFNAQHNCWLGFPLFCNDKGRA